jgi:hypothetical protein
MWALLHNDSLRKDFCTAFVRWGQRMRAKDVCADHTCSCECHFVGAGSVYICQASGNHHVCTSLLCEHVFEQDGVRICQWTRTQFPSSMVDCSEVHAHARESTVDFRRQENTVPKLNHKQGPRALPRYSTIHMPQLFRTGQQLLQSVLFRQTLAPSSTTPSSRKRPHPGLITSTQGSPPPKRARVDAVASEPGVRITTQRHVPRRPIALHQKEVTPQWSNTWVELCIRTWQQINQTDTFRHRAHNKYRFETHCLVVWSLAAEPRGFECNAFRIPADPLMRKGLPNKDSELQSLVGSFACKIKDKNVLRNCAKELNELSVQSLEMSV